MLRPVAISAQDANTRKSNNLEVNISEHKIPLIEPPTDGTDGRQSKLTLHERIFAKPSFSKILTIRAILISL